MKTKVYLLVASLVLPVVMAMAQSTAITLAQADSMLVNGNLNAIAARYEVDMAEAATVQARIFSNPSFTSEWSAYNKATGRGPDIGRAGQKAFSLEKVFQIAGQRNLNIQLAAEQKRMTMAQYEDVVRSLRYQMHTSFFQLFFLRTTADTLQQQVDRLEGLIDAFELQYERGNISLKEVTRLKATFFGLNSDLTTLRTQEAELQATLQVLLHAGNALIPTPAADELTKPEAVVTDEQTLVQQAIQNRPDIKVYESLVKQSEINYSLQKRQAVPNLNAGGLYDQAGSYIPNYYAFTVGFDIPIFNRNQGNIQRAKIGIDQTKVLLEQTQLNVRAEVESAYQQLRLLTLQRKNTGATFSSQLNEIARSSIENYLRKNISLLEFTDLFESYHQTLLQLNDLNVHISQAYEELSYAVGQDVR